MKKIIAFGASNSKTSINKELATYTANLFKEYSAEILDLNEYEMPIYSKDLEEKNGIPQLTKDFYNKLGTADLIIISFAEYNGAYTSAFKNIFDWTTRHEGKMFQNKPMLLMATSPGERGGQTVLDMAKNRIPFHDGEIKGDFSLPNFEQNFDTTQGITNADLKKDLLKIVEHIQSTI
jgi:NAD(P)H-dependent FMN reductase